LRLLSHTYASEGTKTPYARKGKNSGIVEDMGAPTSSEPLFKDETRLAEERHNQNTEA
jgi:hypothetical protein